MTVAPHFTNSELRKADSTSGFWLQPEMELGAVRIATPERGIKRYITALVGNVSCIEHREFVKAP